MDPLLLDAAAVGQLCGGRSAKTVMRWVSRGEGPRSVQVAGRRMWRYSDVAEWVAGLPFTEQPTYELRRVS